MAKFFYCWYSTLDIKTGLLAASSTMKQLSDIARIRISCSDLTDPFSLCLSFDCQNIQSDCVYFIESKIIDILM